MWRKLPFGRVVKLGKIEIGVLVVFDEDSIKKGRIILGLFLSSKITCLRTSYRRKEMYDKYTMRVDSEHQRSC